MVNNSGEGKCGAEGVSEEAETPCDRAKNTGLVVTRS